MYQLFWLTWFSQHYFLWECLDFSVRFITFWLFNIWLVFPVVTPLKKVVSHANFLFNILSPTKSAEPPLDENKTSLSKIWRRDTVPEINSCNWSSLLTSHKATFLKDNHLKSAQFSVKRVTGPFSLLLPNYDRVFILVIIGWFKPCWRNLCPACRKWPFFKSL